MQVGDLLARAAEISFARAAIQHPSFAVRKQEGVHRRVNCMVRKGRLVFVGHEGNCITVWSYDPTLMGAAQPVFVKEFFTKSPVLQLEIRQSSVNALIRSSASIGTVGLELLVVNIASLLTSSGIRNTVTPVPITQSSNVLTFTAGGNTAGARFASIEAGLAELHQQTTAIGLTAREVSDLATGSRLLPTQASALAAIESQLSKVVSLLRAIADPPAPSLDPTAPSPTIDPASLVSVGAIIGSALVSFAPPPQVTDD